MDSKFTIRQKVDLEHMLLDESAKPTYLPLSLLEDITDCFSDDQQIGSGGFAVVYKGMVGKGMVAVKKLSKTFGMHEKKFHKEVECLMKAKHKNIVRFLGYCYDMQGRTADYEGKFVIAEQRSWLLCFEYVPNGSLDKYITDASCGLEWMDRFEIIKGLCEGLLHLHEKRILHLDLKPANILVDEHMVPKIADFGLSRCLDKEQTQTSTLNPCGTMGYLAPESTGGKFTFASDIYCLGVIIVEILTGEKGYAEDEDVVKTWMNRLEGSNLWEKQLEQVRVCIQIGIECINMDPKKRPVARNINDRLKKAASNVEAGIGSSSVEQWVSSLKEQYSQGNIAKLSSEYLGKDIQEHAETEKHVEYVGTCREVHWQQGQEEVPGDQRSLWGAQDTKKNVIPQVSGFDYSFPYGFVDGVCFDDIGYCGPIFEKENFAKHFESGEIKPFLKDWNLIGVGIFGKVYKGILDSVPVVLKKHNSGTMARGDEFGNEVTIQSQLTHKNIVRFIGCCMEVGSPVLVYEFLSNGSLNEILHSNKEPLNLAVRLSIAAGSAGALAYMHSSFTTKILHGDVKPAKIFLDKNFVPKISDARMSRLFVRNYEHIRITTGDLAYTDPVYLQTGILTEQSDVYSFGVVILELLTRKKPTHGGYYSLVRIFIEIHKMGGRSTDLFDKEIVVAEDLEVLDNLAGIALECLNHDVDRRPTMLDVEKRLFILIEQYNTARS